MRIIDRYMLRQYVQVFCICYLSLLGLYVVFDAFSNLDEFLRYVDSWTALLGLLAEFYAYRSILFLDQTSAVLAMIAAMFTVTWIQRHNELTAILAAGIPARRVVVPIVAGAVLISAVGALSRELVIPSIRHHLVRTPHDLDGGSAQELRSRYDHKTDIFIHGASTIAAEKKIDKANFLLPPRAAQWAGEIIADEAYYRSASGDHPEGYLLKNVTSPADIDVRPALEMNGEAVVLTPKGHEWLAPTECFVVSEVTFEQITGQGGWSKFSSTRSLIEGAQNESLDFGADVRVAIHARMVKPVLDVTLLLLGLPIMLRRENRNIFLAIGACVLVVAGYMVVVLGCQYLGGAYLISPALAAWLPVMVFVPIAVTICEPLFV